MTSLTERHFALAKMSGDLALTNRESEIAALVSQGLANKVVARQLGVAEGTVKIHLHNIYQKLRVSNRTGLMRVIANA